MKNKPLFYLVFKTRPFLVKIQLAITFPFIDRFSIILLLIASLGPEMSSIEMTAKNHPNWKMPFSKMEKFRLWKTTSLSVRISCRFFVQLYISIIWTALYLAVQFHLKLTCTVSVLGVAILWNNYDIYCVCTLLMNFI